MNDAYNVDIYLCLGVDIQQHHDDDGGDYVDHYGRGVYDEHEQYVKKNEEEKNKHGTCTALVLDTAKWGFPKIGDPNIVP